MPWAVVQARWHWPTAGKLKLHHFGAISGIACPAAEDFSNILKIGLNNPLNLPLRIVRQLLKVTGGAEKPTQNAIAIH